MTTAPLDDIHHRALLLSQRAALLAMLPVVTMRPELKAGAVQWLGAIEDALGMERTIPRQSHERRKHPGNAPLCACGCGHAARWNGVRFDLYATGHGAVS